MTKQPTITDRVTVVADGKIRTGFYQIEGGMITVHCAGRKTSARLGNTGSNARPLAERMLREVVSESSFA
jgi:hypothetical protein